MQDRAKKVEMALGSYGELDAAGVMTGHLQLLGKRLVPVKQALHLHMWCAVGGARGHGHRQRLVRHAVRVM